MIKFALQCGDCDHSFEAWFASGEAYDKQQAAGLIECPNCMGSSVGKQIMAPSLKGTRKQTAESPEAVFRKFASAARKHIAETLEGDRDFDAFNSWKELNYYSYGTNCLMHIVIGVITSEYNINSAISLHCKINIQ